MMSSPLISLSKPRRAQIAPGTPQRRQLQGTLTPPDGLLMSRPRGQSDPPDTGRRAVPFKCPAGYPGTVPSDFDLLSSTMRRVGELERKVRMQENDIQHKDQEIADLVEKVKKLQTHKIEASPLGSKEQEMEKRCKELQQKICDMERFLSDYGLVWVGDNNPSSSSERATGLLNQGLPSPGSFQPNFDLILENLRDLNVLGGEGESRIEYRDGGACLKTPEPIPLILYNNGIIMFKGPFRSYQETSTQECLKDIMDGFFPSELQSRFPDGVTFQVTDKRNIVFQDRKTWDEFPGPGQTVGGIEKKMQETREMLGPQLTVEQFLSKLPKSIVRKGQVLDIQGPIRETLKGYSIDKRPQEIFVESPSLLSMEERSRHHIAVSTLRIRSESGAQTYKVRMLPTETLGDLRTYISKCRSPNHPIYEIIGQFPHRVYDEDNRTLQEIGLFPNAFLLLRTKTVKKAIET